MPDIILLLFSHQALTMPDIILLLFSHQALTMSLLELYQLVRDRLRPTPVHAHYIFSLHDIARTIQGILLMSPRSRIRWMRIKKKEKENRSELRSIYL
jgi:hypothetical protein